MKRLYTILTALMLTFTVFGQSPQAFKYQAVIRDGSGNIIANEQTELTIEIIQGSISNAAIFSEIHSVTTNAFGLINLEIGSVNATDFQLIDWSNTPYFVKIIVDGTEMGTSQLLSVPFALYANEAKQAENVFSGDYNDLSNQPDLSGYLSSETDPEFNNSVAKGITATDTANWNDKSTFSGNYNDLSNQPDLTNYLTSETDPLFSQSITSGILQEDIDNWNNKSNFSGNYNDLANKPDLTNYDTNWEDDFSGDYNDLTNQPDLTNYDNNVSDDFSGNYADLTNAPDLADTALYLKSETDPDFNISIAKGITATDTANWNNKSEFSGGYNDLLNLPDFSNYDNNVSDDFSGDYGDLTNAPNLADTALYLKSETDPDFDISIAKGITATDTANWNNKSNFSGNYSDLIGKPATISDFSLNASNQRIMAVGSPIHELDAANKAYVDKLENQIELLQQSLVQNEIVVNYNDEIYKTTKIGQQVWMSENLKTQKLNDGTIIHGNFTSGEPAFTVVDGEHYYNYSTVESGNVCPLGWHVAENSDWETLFNYLASTGIPSDKIADALKANSDEWSSDNTDQFYFSAFPRGFYNTSTYSIQLTNESIWWRNEIETGSTASSYKIIDGNGTMVSNIVFAKTNCLSIRCIKD